MIGSMLSLLLAGQPAPPTPPIAEPDETVVVTAGRPITQSGVRRHVEDISLQVSGQLARFATPICPAVIGLPDEHARIVENRIRELARHIVTVAGRRTRATVSDGPCRPNITLIVTPDAEAFVAALRDTQIFRGMDTGDLRNAIEVDGPVRVWHRTQTLNEEYQAASGGAMRVWSPSIISIPTQQVTLEAFVLIEDRAVVGKTLVQLADYAAMRSLAQTRAPEGEGSGTILSLFREGAAAPDAATRLDLSFLTGLYRTAGNSRYLAQRSHISRLVARDLQAPRELPPEAAPAVTEPAP